jgi:hypothetical protein
MAFRYVAQQHCELNISQAEIKVLSLCKPEKQRAQLYFHNVVFFFAVCVRNNVCAREFWNSRSIYPHSLPACLRPNKPYYTQHSNVT